MRRLSCALSCFLVLVCFAPIFAVHAEDAICDTILSLAVSNYSHVILGEKLTVNVTLANVTDMCAWSVWLCWDSSVLTCLDETVFCPSIWSQAIVEFPTPYWDGEKWTGSTPSAMVSGSGIENDLRRYYIGECPVGKAPTFNGTMTLVTLTFQALNVGTCSLTFDPDWTMVLDRNIECIETTSRDCNVTVCEVPNTQAPEPLLVNASEPAGTVLVLIMVLGFLTSLTKRARYRRAEFV